MELPSAPAVPAHVIEDQRPTAGHRFVFLLGAHASGAARYAAAIVAPDAVWHYQVALRAGEAPDVTSHEGAGTEVAAAVPPEPKAVDMLVMIARLTARAAPSRAADGLAPWPPRIVRWRGPGRGG